MENTEEIEARVIAKLKEDFKKCGGANGSDLNDICPIINLPIDERNALLDKMAKEKKIVWINTLNQRRVTIPK